MPGAGGSEAEIAFGGHTGSGHADAAPAGKLGAEIVFDVCAPVDERGVPKIF